MKKILAAILVLTMLFTLPAAAMADEDEGARTLSWITAQRLIEKAELTGNFYQVGDINLDLWIPDMLTAQTDLPDNCYCIFASEDGAATIEVNAVALVEGMELEDVEDYVTERGAESDGFYWINGFDALVYELKDEGCLSVVILVDDGSALEFVFEDVSDPEVYSLASLVMCTIQPHTLEVRDLALMMDADLNSTWGPDKHVSYFDDGSINVNMWEENVNADNIKNVKNWDAVRQDKIDTYELYVRALSILGLKDTPLTLQFTDADQELSFLSIEDGKITYDALA